MDKLSLLHLVLCCFMSGLIWIIQLVHYPSFHFIDKKDFVHFEFFHTKWITVIVMPIMIMEAITQLATLWLSPTLINGIAAIFLLLIWLTTFFFSVPAHQKLASGKDDIVIDKLIHTNWIRTLLWSARAILLFSTLI